MGILRKTEMTLACLLPISALIPILWTILTALVLENPVQFLALLMDSRLPPLYLLGYGAPAIGYSILGLVGILANKRKSTALSGIFCLLLLPMLALSGFLLLTSVVQIGFIAFWFYSPPPLIAITLVPVSWAVRFFVDQHASHDKAPDLV